MDTDPHPAPSLLLLDPLPATRPADAVVVLAEIAAVLGLEPRTPGLVLAGSASL